MIFFIYIFSLTVLIFNIKIVTLWTWEMRPIVAIFSLEFSLENLFLLKFWKIRTHKWNTILGERKHIYIIKTPNRNIQYRNCNISAIYSSYFVLEFATNVPLLLLLLLLLLLMNFQTFKINHTNSGCVLSVAYQNLTL